MDECVDMIWRIQVRPYFGWTGYIRIFTSSIVSTLARNFQVHVQEGPDAVVLLRPPRGDDDMPSWGSVPKACWLGRVLDAHVHDTRSTWQQTKSLFQPWTWGVSTSALAIRTRRDGDNNKQGDGDDDSFVEGWTRGFMEPRPPDVNRS